MGTAGADETESEHVKGGNDGGPGVHKQSFIKGRKSRQGNTPVSESRHPLHILRPSDGVSGGIAATRHGVLSRVDVEWRTRSCV